MKRNFCTVLVEKPQKQRLLGDLNVKEVLLWLPTREFF
jgi:hypothetical protein